MTLDALETRWQEAMARSAREQSRDATDAQHAVESELFVLACTCGHEYGNHETGRGRCAPRVMDDCECMAFAEDLTRDLR